MSKLIVNTIETLDGARSVNITDMVVSSDISSQLAAHVALSDPHPAYTTSAEATTLINSAVAAHAALADPHPTYTTAAEVTTMINAIGGGVASFATGNTSGGSGAMTSGTTTGNYNTAFGSEALVATTSGTTNTAVIYWYYRCQ
jgi:hypothetical protein